MVFREAEQLRKKRALEEDHISGLEDWKRIMYLEEDHVPGLEGLSPVLLLVPPQGDGMRTVADDEAVDLQ